jgi:hypothetical protein
MLVSVAVQPRGAELTVRSQAKDLHLIRPFAIEGVNRRTVDKYTRVRAAGREPKFPRRPHSEVLSESIILFFIARNGVGLWIAREAEGRTGGIFLFKKSALRFAQQNNAASGCATMFLAERLELDVENRGNQLIGWIGGVLSLVAHYIPEYPPPLPMLEKRRKSEWL